MAEHGTTRVAILCAPEGTEQVELTSPREALESAGAEVDLLSTEDGEIQAFNHLDRADAFAVDRVVEASMAADYDALMLPGGVANPDNLRMNEEAVSFVRNMVQAGKPVAAICHAPWTLIEAGVVSGREMTSWPSLATDLRNAGADWFDKEVVVCDQDPNVLVTSRKPDDLDAFNREMLHSFGLGDGDAES